MSKIKLYAKILEAKKEIGVVSKNAKNPHFKNTYADINALIEAVEPILLKNGLILLQPIIDGCQYTTIIDSESGEQVDSFLPLPQISDPQKLGSAVTYFRRYTLQSLLSLMADDDDGNLASKAKQVTKLEDFEIAAKVNSCKDLAELTKLYNENKPVSTEVQKVFEAKKRSWVINNSKP